MLFLSSRSLISRQLPSATRPFSRGISTQRINQPPFYKSKAFSAATGAVFGTAVTYWIFDSVRNSTQSTYHLHDFYHGSLEWEGKAIKPFDLKDATEFLRRERAPIKAQWEVVFNDGILLDVLAIPFVKITL